MRPNRRSGDGDESVPGKVSGLRRCRVVKGEKGERTLVTSLVYPCREPPQSIRTRSLGAKARSVTKPCGNAAFSSSSSGWEQGVGARLSFWARCEEKVIKKITYLRIARGHHHLAGPQRLTRVAIVAGPRIHGCRCATSGVRRVWQER